MNTPAIQLHAHGKPTGQTIPGDRYTRQHSGWQSITYKGRRYQLFGGVRTPEWINIDRPIPKRKEQTK